MALSTSPNLYIIDTHACMRVGAWYVEMGQSGVALSSGSEGPTAAAGLTEKFRA